VQLAEKYGIEVERLESVARFVSSPSVRDSPDDHGGPADRTAGAPADTTGSAGIGGDMTVCSFLVMATIVPLIIVFPLGCMD
jgi:hypothetical protein